MYGKTKNSAILNYDNNYYSNSPFIDNITLKKHYNCTQLSI